MKPKNSKERRNSFLKFLLLFLVTVGIIITAVFFTYKVPNKENTLLKEQAKAIEKEIEFQKGFYKETVSVKSMIDSLDVPGQNIDFQNSLISKKLAALQGKIPTKDSKINFDLYNNIINMYVELQVTKDKLRDLKGAESKIKEYKEALDKCKDDYQQAQRDLQVARYSSN
ncbi:type VI secretion system TssO [uncultured Algibacter sp.]|uniref:type VI secretion system TssO n=1 Tax=uncultured Algibacter sp. TaxID=298659 RepID=UPI0032174905